MTKAFAFGSTPGEGSCWPLPARPSPQCALVDQMAQKNLRKLANGLSHIGLEVVTYGEFSVSEQTFMVVAPRSILH